MPAFGATMTLGYRIDRLGCLGCLLATAVAVPAMDIQQALTGEILVEGIFQKNYTDANGATYTRTDPNIYTTLPTVTTDTQGNTYVGGLLVDPRTYRLTVQPQDQDTYYQDSANQLWLRARLGSKVEVGDSLTAELGAVFDAEGGDKSQDGAAGSNNGGVYLNDANVLLKHLFIDPLHLRAGRQPVSWNLRRNYGAWLYDSRADNPKVTGWDGARAYLQYDDFTVQPWFFMIDSAREAKGLMVEGDGTETGVSSSKDDNILGLTIDWQPQQWLQDRLFTSVTFTSEVNAPVEPAQGIYPALIAKRLYNYYLGVEARLGGGFTLYAEGSFQDGTLSREQDIRAYGWSGGLDWDLLGDRTTALGLQYDFKSGDRKGQNGNYQLYMNPDSWLAPFTGLDPATRAIYAEMFPVDPSNQQYNNYISPWEGVSDLLIAEHERYGELTRLLTGNLHTAKLRAEWRLAYFTPSQPLDLKFNWGYMVVDKPAWRVDTLNSSNAAYFGNEADLSATWAFTTYASMSLFGGMFFPGRGYRQLAAERFPTSRDLPKELRDVQWLDSTLNGGQPGAVSAYIDAVYPNETSDEDIWLFGINTHVVF
jgi:hypothetical protein